MKTCSLFIIGALSGAALLSATASREPFAARLVRLEAAVAVPEMASVLEHESIAVNAVLLDYAASPELRHGAAHALRRYPQFSRDILPLWPEEPEFREVLTEYGPAIMPPIAYFMQHEIRTLQLMRAAGDAVTGARKAAQNLLGSNAAEQPGEEGAGSDALTAVDRGWQAIAFIRQDGHDFLGQFVVDADQRVEWVQTERISEAAAQFFTSGIRTLETRYRRNEQPDAMDYLWAGVDVALSVGAAKTLRLGRLAGTGTRAGTRATLTTRTLLRGGRVALRGARYGVPVAVAYAVLRHPSLISGLAAQAANLLGWPVALVQAALWFVILLPLMLILRWILRWFVRPTVFALRVTVLALRRLQRRRYRHKKVDQGQATKPAQAKSLQAANAKREGLSTERATLRAP